MSESSRAAQVALLRKLQIMSPIAMTIVAVIVYWAWKDDMSKYVALGLVLFGVLDYFIIKFLADTTERS